MARLISLMTCCEEEGCALPAKFQLQNGGHRAVGKFCTRHALKRHQQLLQDVAATGAARRRSVAAANRRAGAR